MLEQQRGAVAIWELGVGDAWGCAQHSLSRLLRRPGVTLAFWGWLHLSGRGDEGVRDGFPGDKPPHEVTMEERGGGIMGP